MERHALGDAPHQLSVSDRGYECKGAPYGRSEPAPIGACHGLTVQASSVSADLHQATRASGAHEPTEDFGEVRGVQRQQTHATENALMCLVNYGILDTGMGRAAHQSAHRCCRGPPQSVHALADLE